MPERPSLFPIAEVRRDATADPSEPWEVMWGERLLARFPIGEKTNAMDFCNGFNAGLWEARHA